MIIIFKLSKRKSLRNAYSESGEKERERENQNQLVFVK